MVVCLTISQIVINVKQVQDENLSTFLGNPKHRFYEPTQTLTFQISDYNFSLTNLPMLTRLETIFLSSLTGIHEYNFYEPA